MCEFCKNIANTDEEFQARLNGEDFIFRSGREYGILIDTGDSGCPGSLNNVRFCPMCGRKLVEE